MSHEFERKYEGKVVVIGGGTGPFNLLRGLVRQINNPANITSIYTTWDSGGSTGKLRTELGVLPMGDARRQLLALIPDPIKQQIWIDLFEHRMTFSGEKHTIGNLTLMGLDQVYPGEGMEAAKNIMDVRSNILPVSTNALELGHKASDPNEAYGEHLLDERGEQDGFDPNKRISSIFFLQKPRANMQAVQAIQEARKIILSSGSLVGSIAPNLLIPEFRDAILDSDAELIYIQNVMTEHGQTDGFDAADHLAFLNKLLGKNNRINYLIAHDNHIDPNVLAVYKSEHQEPVIIDEAACTRLWAESPNLKIIKEQIAKYIREMHLIRHEPDNIALAVLYPEEHNVLSHPLI